LPLIDSAGYGLVKPQPGLINLLLDLHIQKGVNKFMCAYVQISMVQPLESVKKTGKGTGNSDQFNM
jgi:hypothetical protein